MPKQVFVRNPATGEPAYIVGALADREAVAKGIGYIILSELEADIDLETEGLTVEVTVEDMTPEEVADLPTC
jgi:hypothetical protein